MSGLKPNEIKAEILRLGFSQSRLAEEFGVSKSQLSQVINGHRVLPLVRKRLARKLRRSVRTVFGQHHPQLRRQEEKQAA
jgi:transcriptional regulator with XRE-family HTH domain